MIQNTELSVRVVAPSRLHFGLLAWGSGQGREFGGTGVMIAQPTTEVVVRMRGPYATDGTRISEVDQRAAEFAARFRDSLDDADQRALINRLDIRVRTAPPAHAGLGSGTQLAMSLGRALAAFVGLPEMPVAEIARRVGRGQRSAIGVHGFLCGGFLVDGGKRDPQELSPLVARLNFPADWHFVVIIPADAQGLHGAAELDAFAKLPPIPPEVTADLCRLTLLGMLPAVAGRDFEAFSESLFEYGQKVGRCFASVQGNIFADPSAGAIVETVRGHGFHGIAQSSWGPSIAVVTNSRFRAEWLAARLRDSLGSDAAAIVCSPPNNLGAKIEVLASERTRAGGDQ